MLGFMVAIYPSAGVSLPFGMSLPLLLDFTAGNARFLGGLVWKAAGVLWVPQVLALGYVLHTRRRRPRSLASELGVVLLPLILGVAALTVGVPVALLVYLYADVHWGAWFLAVLFPTATGLLGVGLTHRLSPAEVAAKAVPTPWSRSPLLYTAMCLACLGVLVWQVLLRNRPAKEQTPHWSPPDPATRAREDSLRARHNEARARAYFDSVERVRSQPGSAPW